MTDMDKAILFFRELNKGFQQERLIDTLFGDNVHRVEMFDIACNCMNIVNNLASYNIIEPIAQTIVLDEDCPHLHNSSVASGYYVNLSDIQDYIHDELSFSSIVQGYGGGHNHDNT